jgi:hypothetical protein
MAARPTPITVKNDNIAMKINKQVASVRYPLGILVLTGVNDVYFLCN